MKKIFLIILLVLMLLPAVFAETYENEQVMQVIYENLLFSEREDVESMMRTLHPESPGYAYTRKLMEKAFQMFDLKYELINQEVRSVADDEAKVYFKQKTIKVGGDAEFKDNIIEGVHTLKKYNGKWLIYSTKIDRTQYLQQ